MLVVLRVAARSRTFAARPATRIPYCRSNGTVTSSEQETTDSDLPRNEAWLFIDSVFPVRFGTWDFRHYIGVFREGSLLGRLETILRSVNTHGFEPVSVESRAKDGGVFVGFKYIDQAGERALQDIVQSLKQSAASKGGIPSWNGLKYPKGDFWLVKGKPWREDLNRFASPMLKVSFDGPDIREEGLYELLRPFGRIMDLTSPTPGPAGSLRSSIVTFRHVRSAATAHNCVHGLAVPSNSNAVTKLQTSYEQPIKAHAIRNWIMGHPKIVMPILVFLLGTLTYTIFDPIRAIAVEGKLRDWFDYKNSGWFRWVRRNTIDRLSFASHAESTASVLSEPSVWKEREQAEADIRRYLGDFPNSVTFVHGPQGSGKTRMLDTLVEDYKRPVLRIDCAELYKASSDAAVLRSLAHQTGYWPIFPFVNSLNNLIDMASMGIIGQKAGLSTSLDVQVKDLLEVVGSALINATTHERTRTAREAESSAVAVRRVEEEKRRRERMMLATWHDGRLDCVAGNGVMSELGGGDELMREDDYDKFSSDVVVRGGRVEISSSSEKNNSAEVNDTERKAKVPSKDLEVLEALPIVIIKNYATERGKDEVLSVLAHWAASLVENKIAHVIVISDNRENAKHLAQALPTKPLYSVAISDADAASALAFVAKKLQESGVRSSFTQEQTVHISRLGGRSSDLESLVHKVRSGQPVEDAVEDIITRSLSEVRKNAFGEDSGDAKSLPWKREQAWAVMRRLASADELAYHEVLLDFPFKGDEVALRNMEHAELITIGTVNGRPSVIKPGRPIYKHVFVRLVDDTPFCAVQDIASNTLRIASAESTIRACEEELLNLHAVGATASHWWSRRPTTAVRASYLMKKMQEAEAIVEKLELANAALKKNLVKAA